MAHALKAQKSSVRHQSAGEAGVAASAADSGTFERVVRAARRRFDTAIALVSLREADNWRYVTPSGVSVGAPPAERSFCGSALRQLLPLVVTDAAADARFASMLPNTRDACHRFYAGRALRDAQGFALGTLCVMDPAPRSFNDDAREELDDLADWAEAALARWQLGCDRRALAQMLGVASEGQGLDAELKVWDREAITGLLERETRRVARSRGALSVLRVDVDQLQSLDARYGRAVSSTVLKSVAQSLRGTLRPYDAVGRYAEDEFLVVLPDSDEAGAAVVGERLRRRVTEDAMAVGVDRISCTLSVGAAAVQADALAPSAEGLLAAAGGALREAKRAGCNRVHLAGRSSPRVPGALRGWSAEWSPLGR